MYPRALLSHLHRVFDPRPDRVLALRVEALNALSEPQTHQWRIDADLLTLTPLAGDSLTIDLSLHTLASLAATIDAQPDWTVLYSNPELLAHDARVLIDGAGDSGDSNGDHIHAARNPLWHLLHAWQGELDAVESSIPPALMQLNSRAAEGEWLDLWGTYYGVARLDGETDPDYAERIIREVLRPRVGARAIEMAAEDSLGGSPAVSIFEPWRALFTLSHTGCRLSGPGRINDGRYWAYCTIEVRSSAPLPLLRPAIERNRAAGVLPWYRHEMAFGEGPGGVLAADTSAWIDSTVLVAKFTQRVLPRLHHLRLSIAPPELSGAQRLWHAHRAWYVSVLDARVFGFAAADTGDTVLRAYTVDGRAYIAPPPDPVALYDRREAGTGPSTIPLYAGARWRPANLDALGYRAGHAVLDVAGLATAPQQTVLLVIQQTDL